MDLAILVSAFIVVFLLLLFVLLFKTKTDFFTVESESRRAGRLGEAYATQVIQEVLNEKDILLTNVNITFDGKSAELDNVVINNRGVFIIEVKNYSGELCGNEEDDEWIKTKVTNGGYYQKVVRNPIKQVKRQVYILSKYLKECGKCVWVEGYVFLVEGNSPVNNEYVLWNQGDINKVIHDGRNNNLTNSAVERIYELLL